MNLYLAVMNITPSKSSVRLFTLAVEEWSMYRHVSSHLCVLRGLWFLWNLNSHLPTVSLCASICFHRTTFIVFKKKKKSVVHFCHCLPFKLYYIHTSGGIVIAMAPSWASNTRILSKGHCEICYDSDGLTLRLPRCLQLQIVKKLLWLCELTHQQKIKIKNCKCLLLTENELGVNCSLNSVQL